MPIDKATGGKVCINGCGALATQALLERPDFAGYFVTSAVKLSDGSISRGDDVFTVDVWACPQCGYIELYDHPPEASANE